MGKAKTDMPFRSSCNRLQPAEFIQIHVTVPLCFGEAVCSNIECFEFLSSFSSMALCFLVWKARDIRAVSLRLKNGEKLCEQGTETKTKIQMCNYVVLSLGCFSPQSFGLTGFRPVTREHVMI